MTFADFVRVFVTVAGFFCFLAICIWAFSKRSRAGFEEAANAPLLDDDTPRADKQAS